MEFLRFGSSIPGMYWGCCAVDIAQYFKVDPDAKASIQVVVGDSGTGCWVPGTQEFAFLGTTYREIFWNRLKINTFNTGEKPNHAFFAILTAQQLAGDIGKKWLAILKEAGFEFIRTTSNAVYTGQAVRADVKDTGNEHPNYIFGLFLNIGSGNIRDPFEPPKAWTDLDQVAPDVSIDFPLSAKEKKKYREETFTAQKAMWEAHPTKLYKESEIVAAGIEPTYAANRTNVPQGTKTTREAALKLQQSSADLQAVAKARKFLKAAGLDDAKANAVIASVQAEEAAANKKTSDALKPQAAVPVPVAAALAPASG